MLRHDLICHFSPGLEARPSPIHGHGLHTSEFREKGSFLLRFGGRLYGIEDRYSEALILPTVIGVSDQVILAEPIEGRIDLSDYVNHACDPTAGLSDAVTLVARHDLEPGTEITVDYSWWEADEDWRMDRCGCVSANCRGTVTAHDALAIDPSSSDFEILSPFVRRRVLAARGLANN